DSVADGEVVRPAPETTHRGTQAAAGTVVVVAARLRALEVRGLDSCERRRHDPEVADEKDRLTEGVTRKEPRSQKLCAEDLRGVVDVFVLLGEAEDVARRGRVVGQFPAFEDAALLQTRNRPSPGGGPDQSGPGRVQRVPDA